MQKFLIAIATAVFAIATMHTSSAQAGFKGRLAVGLAIGALGVMAHRHHRYERHRRWRNKHQVRRRSKATKKVYVSKEKTEPEVAKVAESVEAPIQKAALNENQMGALNENSSITTAALPATDEVATQTQSDPVEETAQAGVSPEPAADTGADAPKTASKLDCKKFFPSVGMTLTVPCE